LWRVFLVFLSLVGLYPQYRALKTICIGVGWYRGNWEEEHRLNRIKIYVIEPIMESLLQARHFISFFNLHQILHYIAQQNQMKMI
jgi:hypothetical protein